ncbi:DNA-binding protein WhiA [Hydrogenibacillus sp. N12]|uniref:DNA-binding protein WhiA n=1 Tax=Hydrogenibacillus sp. N12 TaxID=2866627 RepID=UPI001C7D3E36|nr:DNA-binding protein WhiA [Hydrogenibacillus sp. N12]QZA32772.1 DNA-binding protein WhiA [Hydrogenibacillus sp. N12]
MSFAREAKNELTRIQDLPACCRRAELSALARLNGRIVDDEDAGRPAIEIATENAAIARRIYVHVRDVLGAPGRVIVRKNRRLRKNNTYVIRLPLPPEAVAERLGLRLDSVAGAFVGAPTEEVTKKTCCKRSYLRAAFLARGSVNAPSAHSYHLELTAGDGDHADRLEALFRHFGLFPRRLVRPKGTILYLKEGDQITEFLSLIGAHNSLFRFEDVRIMKDMRNTINRLVNAETANLNKAVRAAMAQVRDITLIQETIGLESLPPKLREVAEARLRHPEANLKELGELLPGGPVSKSGINHRLRKIHEIAMKIQSTRRPM